MSNDGAGYVMKGPCGDGIVGFLTLGVSHSLFLSFSRSLCASGDVVIYADRLTLKRGSQGEQKGLGASPGTRQTRMRQRIHAILKAKGPE